MDTRSLIQKLTNNLEIEYSWNKSHKSFWIYSNMLCLKIKIKVSMFDSYMHYPSEYNFYVWLNYIFSPPTT